MVEAGKPANISLAPKPVSLPCYELKLLQQNIYRFINGAVAIASVYIHLFSFGFASG
jgi:hypothetical protein